MDIIKCISCTKGIHCFLIDKKCLELTRFLEKLMVNLPSWKLQGVRQDFWDDNVFELLGRLELTLRIDTVFSVHDFMRI